MTSSEFCDTVFSCILPTITSLNEEIQRVEEMETKLNESYEDNGGTTEEWRTHLLNLALAQANCKIGSLNPNEIKWHFHQMDTQALEDIAAGKVDHLKWLKDMTTDLHNKLFKKQMGIKLVFELKLARPTDFKLITEFLENESDPLSMKIRTAVMKGHEPNDVGSQHLEFLEEMVISNEKSQLNDSETPKVFWEKIIETEHKIEQLEFSLLQYEQIESDMCSTSLEPPVTYVEYEHGIDFKAQELFYRETKQDCEYFYQKLKRDCDDPSKLTVATPTIEELGSHINKIEKEIEKTKNEIKQIYVKNTGLKTESTSSIMLSQLRSDIREDKLRIRSILEELGLKTPKEINGLQPNGISSSSKSDIMEAVVFQKLDQVYKIYLQDHESGINLIRSLQAIHTNYCASVDSTTIMDDDLSPNWIHSESMMLSGQLLMKNEHTIQAEVTHNGQNYERINIMSKYYQTLSGPMAEHGLIITKLKKFHTNNSMVCSRRRRREEHHRRTDHPFSSSTLNDKLSKYFQNLYGQMAKYNVFILISHQLLSLAGYANLRDSEQHSQPCTANLISTRIFDH